MLKKLLGGKNSKNSKYQIVTKQPTSETCPYCGYKFEKIPKRKKRCPECENEIFVRWGKLYTEEEKDIKDWLDSYNIKELGITRDEFNKSRQELSKEFGFIASVNDTFWRILTTINTPDKSFSYRKLVYLAMTHILKMEGKSTDEVMAKAQKMEIAEGKIANEESAKAFIEELLKVKGLNDRSGTQMVGRILTCNDEHVCDECKKISKMIFTIEEALEAMPIPHKCTNIRCRCYYGFSSSLND